MFRKCLPPLYIRGGSWYVLLSVHILSTPLYFFLLLPINWLDYRRTFIEATSDLDFSCRYNLQPPFLQYFSTAGWKIVSTYRERVYYCITYFWEEAMSRSSTLSKSVSTWHSSTTTTQQADQPTGGPALEPQIAPLNWEVELDLVTFQVIQSHGSA